MSDQRPDPSLFKNWLVANESKKGTKEYATVEQAYSQSLRAPGAKPEGSSVKQMLKDELSQQYIPTGIFASSPAAMAVGRLAENIDAGGEMIRSASIRATPAVAGELIGQKVGGSVGRRVGAGAGALVGSMADQYRQRGNVKMGETLADVATAVINPRNPVAAGLSTAALDTAGQVLDNGNVSLRRAAMSGFGGAVGAMAGNKMAGKQMNPKDALMIERYKALEEVKPYGVVVNPAEIERGVQLVNQFSGVDAMSNQASHSNQFAWQKMAREQIELPTDSKELAFKPSHRKGGTYVKGTLDEQVEKLSAPYREIEQISKDIVEEIRLSSTGKLTNPKFLTSSVTKEGVDAMAQAKGNLLALKNVRFEMRDALKKQSEGVPGAREELNRLKGAEEVLEQRLELAAIASGKEGLLDQLKEARQKIAVVKAVDNATTSYGLVDPKLLSIQREAGVGLTGNLEKIALFYDAFKPSATEAVASGPQAFTGLSANYTARNIAQGNRQGLFSGGFPVAAQQARNLMLGPKMQERFSKPRMSTVDNPVTRFLRLAPALANPQENPSLPGYPATTMIAR